MNEIKIKRLTLLLMEILILKKGILNQSFANAFNNFISDTFKENEELFDLIYDKDLLQYFITYNYEIISLNQIIKLINDFHGFEGYLSLVEEVGYKVDNKLNEIALKFLEYYNYLIDLATKDIEWVPTCYKKILQ